ncbi:hypothetical protein BJ741DRAFT_715338 [Chytriomyces cf. hyalinus JEL632]|nr:hypothetical protein BJ741DRAFT_715338 [Chytriomyces cf. hyalinus JEL632]
MNRKVRQLFADQDTGPHTYLLQQVRNAASPTGVISGDFNERVVASRRDFRAKAVELERLVRAVQTRASEDRDFKRRTTAKSVAAWVHATNKIEFAGMPILSDTEAVIRAGTSGLAKVSRSEREVLQTLDLIQRCYEPEILNHPKPATLLSVDLETFKLFHQILMTKILSASGQFRTFGVETNNGDSVHNYLHHSCIKMVLTNLGYILHRLMRGAEDILSDPADRILDWVLPFPFPMFNDRDRYLSTLIHGRNLPALDSPNLLLELLLDEAIEYYKGQLPQESVHFLCAETEHEFKAVVQTLWDSGVTVGQAEMTEIIRGLGEGEETEVMVGPVRFIIKKFEGITYIDDI